MTDIPGKVAPRNWTTTLMFALTFAAAVILVPWYGLTEGYSAAAWLWFGLLVVANEMSITCGYHRLYAHASYEAHPVLKVVYLLFGAMALQNSALLWSAGHRVHHKHIDDNERDPYSAGRGFWFSHIGWMLREYPSGVPDLSTVRDLQRDKLLMLQHRFYLPIALTMNIGLPLLLGWLSGDLWGVFLLGGLLRLVVSHHFTFFINSLAHMWGTKPYNEENTARDNGLIAVLTFGEGYHNFHHMFAHDYRNGVRWWQFDPSKWFINVMGALGLAKRLKRVPWFKIQRALLDAQFARANRQLAEHPHRAQFEHLRHRIAEEYETFVKAVAEWSQLREHWIEDTRSALHARLRELESRLQLQIRRMRILQAQIA